MDDPAPWILIYRSANPALVALAKSLLQSADIPFQTRDEGSHGTFPGVPFVGRARMFAPPDRAEEAKTLLNDLKSTESNRDEDFFGSASEPAKE